MGLTLSSCELLGPPKAGLIPLPPITKEKTNGADAVVFKDLQNKSSSSDQAETKSEIYPGTGHFVPQSTPQHRRVTTTGAGAYSLNFDEADLGEVAKVILSDILGLNYVLSPKVAGKVTLQTTEALTKEELMPTLEMVLRMNNAALVRDGRIYHIEPAAEALYSSDIASGAARPGYQTKVIPIKNVAVQEIADLLKPLVHDKTILHVDGTRNILIASGTPDEMARVMDMVNTFDIDVLRGRSFGVFSLAHVDPETIIDELEEVFKSSGKEGDNEFFRFIPIERLSAILAITHQASYLHDIENWIRRLDKANSATGGGVNVYKVQHSDAEELADTLNEIFTGAQKKEKSAKVAPGKKSGEISNKPAEDKSTSKKGSVSSKPTGDANVSNVGDVRIISDKANNSIIIVATPHEYQVILPVIKQLDILPLQVLIDAMIVSVDLKDDLKYGIQWFLDHGGSSISNGAGAVTLGSVASASAAAFTSGGLSAVYNSGVVNAILSSQALKNNVNIISSPSLMVLNNQEATIEVGTQIPILSSTLSGAGITTDGTGTGGTSGLVTNSQIQYKDTGVKLEVTPRVNANGMVIMEIKQSVSDPVESTIGVQSSAAIDKKEINSSVAVLDGETIVLGGLIKETNTYNKAGVPWFHQLPWVGPLFGNTTNNKDKTELVVLITPRVVKSKQDSRLVTNEFRRKLTGIYEDRSVKSIYRR